MHQTTTVVGVDGADGGWQALAWATDEVAARGGRLVICRVYATSGPAVPLGPSPAALELADPTLARAVAAVRARLGGDRVSVTVRTGDPSRRLIQVAERADLLVLGAPTVTGRVALATTAGRVAAQARGAVVVVHPVPDASGPFAGHVVVGVDGGESARAALGYGFAYANAHRLPLVALQIVPGSAEELTVEPDPDDGELIRWREMFPHVQVRRVTGGGRPGPGLLRAAYGARLLAVGDRGLPTAARFLLGSVSQYALAHAAGPVAVVHPQHHASLEEAASLEGARP
jgi:nucleotide-binding universal stress UspA family protein